MLSNLHFILHLIKHILNKINKNIDQIMFISIQCIFIIIQFDEIALMYLHGCSDDGTDCDDIDDCIFSPRIPNSISIIGDDDDVSGPNSV